jgi:hypothetical protein
LGHVSPAELRELVVHQHLRPERPEHHEAPQLMDEIWKLMEDCWVDNPSRRPTADAICDCIHSILDNRRISQPVPSEPKLAANFEPLTALTSNYKPSTQISERSDIISSNSQSEGPRNQELVLDL